VIPDLSVLWVIVLVLALTFIVQRFLFGPLLRVMHPRESATANAQALAAEAGRRAQAATVDYDAQMSAARADLYRQMDTVRRGALDRSAAFLAQARQDAEATRSDAVRSLDVSVNGVMVCRGGLPGEAREAVDLTPRDVHIGVDLHAGQASATIWTNDLSLAYVHENSAYSS